MNVQLKEALSETHDQFHNHGRRDKAATFLVSENGMILDANVKGARLLGCSPKHSAKHHISRLLPNLAEIDLLEEGGERVNPYLRYLSRIGYNFKIIASDGKHFTGELFFSDLKNIDQHQILIMIYPIDDGY